MPLKKVSVLPTFAIILIAEVSHDYLEILFLVISISSWNLLCFRSDSFHDLRSFSDSISIQFNRQSTFVSSFYFYGFGSRPWSPPNGMSCSRCSWCFRPFALCICSIGRSRIREPQWDNAANMFAEYREPCSTSCWFEEREIGMKRAVRSASC